MPSAVATIGHGGSPTGIQVFMFTAQEKHLTALLKSLMNSNSFIDFSQTE